MSDYRIVPVDNLNYQAVGGSTANNSTGQPQQPVQGVPNSGNTINSTTSSQQQSKSSISEPEKSKNSLPVTNNSEVSLKFQIDEETHIINVFIIDRASNRVLRAIPPEELNKLKAGDLLQMLA
jgi:uncharacterized FlaG/YvyC family protein